MIPIHRTTLPAAAPDARIKIIGLGGAGSNALDRIVLDGAPGAETLAINTDVQALTGSVAGEKVQLGRATTRGLGAGGDPEVGYAAAEETAEELRAAVAGAKIVFLCVGLGGGTGSGAARIVAALAREQQAHVVAIATMPFAFEGKRRMAQAEEALAALQRNSDLTICFENDRMSDSVSPLAGIQEAFAVADQTISQSVRALASLSQQRGLIHIGFDELATILRGAGDASARCLFGYGEAEGDNRAHEALARALKCPLMDKGRLLENARNILISVSGGASMTLNEVQILMEEFNRQIGDQARLHFGASVDARLGQKLTVTLLSALDSSTTQSASSAPAHPASRIESSPVSVPVIHAPLTHRAIEPDPVPAPRTSEPVHREIDPAPATAPDSLPFEPAARGIDAERLLPPAEPEPELVKNSALAPAAAPVPPAAAASAKTVVKAKPLARQEQMQFEPVARGRFEKSEPTIVDGQDLDVPTFLRRNVRVK